MSFSVEEPHAVLEALLRPPGQGLYLVSTGRADQESFACRYLGARDASELTALHRCALDRIASAKVVILAIPSDVGAGYRRGASLGPSAIRRALLEADPSLHETFERAGVLDVGDVLVIPQLLSDEMLSDAQLAASRRALYGDEGSALPVSPLSMAERALDAIFAINPDVVPFVLGGDHSVAWPVVASLAKRSRNFGIVQVDAHTDLLPERLGIRTCFATWTHHANALLGRGGRVVQVGIRASGRDRLHWESTEDVRQIWASDFLAAPRESIAQVRAWIRESGVEGVYFSNDIDGTDARWADATGTPEPGGLEPAHVEALIDAIAEEVPIIAADLVEVAPPLSATRTTVEVGAGYARRTLAALLRGQGKKTRA